MTQIRWGGKWVHLAYTGSFPIFLPKIVKIGGNLTKLWQKQICLVFFGTRCRKSWKIYLLVKDVQQCSMLWNIDACYYQWRQSLTPPWSHLHMSLHSNLNPHHMLDSFYFWSVPALDCSTVMLHNDNKKLSYRKQTARLLQNIEIRVLHSAV